MTETQPRRIVLASASPRRRELLALLGLPFEVEVADVDEAAFDTGSPRDDAARSALAKASAVAQRGAGRLVVGADTMVALDGRVFNKPADRAQAREFLQALSGRTHSVLTGVALVDGDNGAARVELDETAVTFRALAAAEIEAYLDTPEPYDKAGAYGIQGLAGRFVARVEGDYYNVVGLPLQRVLRMLGEFIDTTGLRVPAPPWPLSQALSKGG